MCCCLHSSFAEVAAQKGAQVAKHRLAADDEDPGIHDGVKGVESESGQMLFVIFEWIKGIDKANNLKSKKKLRLDRTSEKAMLFPSPKKRHIIDMPRDQTLN